VVSGVRDVRDGVSVELRTDLRQLSPQRNGREPRLIQLCLGALTLRMRMRTLVCPAIRATARASFC
jgi:hypothetical protein